MLFLKRLLFFFLAAILGGVASLALYQTFFNNPTLQLGSNPSAKLANYEVRQVTIPTFDFAEVSSLVTPTVVHIKVTTGTTSSNRNPREMSPFDFFNEDFGMGAPRGPQVGSGSGVIVSADGYIITNNHVVGDADKIEVILFDKRSFTAQVVGKDPNTDLALIRIDADNLQPVKFGKSDQTRVGEWVLAVGNPFNLTSTVTAGIVSAKGRNINLLEGGGSIESFIQTDAAVNPGNSGGALVNTRGELIGINTAIATQTGQYAGYSFAVPVDLVKKVMGDFMEFGEVQRGYLGVNIRDVDASLAQEKGLERIQGVYVENLTENSASDVAGIKKGDVILQVNGKAVNSIPELQETIGRLRPGNGVKLQVLRGSETKEYTVLLRNKDGNTGTSVSADKEQKKTLGAELLPITTVEKNKYGIKSGVKVSEVSSGAFKKSNIPIGFIILTVDRVNVYSPADVHRLLEDKEGGLLLEGITLSGDRKYLVLEMTK